MVDRADHDRETPSVTPATVGLDVLWQSFQLSSMEHFRFRQGDGIQTLNGNVVLLRRGQPTTISYQAIASVRWEVAEARIAVEGSGKETVLEVRTEGGSWWVDESERPDLAGCTDLDLGWTPSTNTLPMRRTNLEVGKSVTIRAAWVSFPDLTLHPVEQSYLRHDQHEWAYSAGAFRAKLITDDLAFVLKYGDDIWSALAHTSIPSPPESVLGANEASDSK